MFVFALLYESDPDRYCMIPLFSFPLPILSWLPVQLFLQLLPLPADPDPNPPPELVPISELDLNPEFKSAAEVDPALTRLIGLDDFLPIMLMETISSVYKI